MKQVFTKAILLIALIISSSYVYSQANTSLSNLASPTTINRTLSPNANNVLDLGSTTRNWRNLYIGAAYYLKNERIIHAPGTTNFFIGSNAGNPLTSGLYNTGGGQNVLANVSTGMANSAFGFRSLENNTTGEYNTAFGAESLNANSTGSGNAAFGGWALINNTSGSGNTAIGQSTMIFSSTGNNNTALGHFSLYSNQSGYDNSASGRQSLYNNTTGYRNIAAGHEALYSNTTGSYNNASGYQALYSSSTASYNSAFGSTAMRSTTTASYNSAFGSNALFANTTGSFNTALGRRALQNNTTGTYNTAVGYMAGPTINNLTNTTAIGYNARPLISNEIWLGNSSVISIRAAAAFVIMSDGRFKKDQSENVPGLEFIKLLKPVTYHYDIRGIDQKTGATKARQQLSPLSNEDNNAESEKAGQIEKNAIDAKEKKLYTGFVAQDVEAAAKKLHYDFSGLHTPQNENDVYGLSYSDFVVPLVKGMQELSNKNDSLQQLVESLEERLTKMEAVLKLNPSSALTLSNASIAQNSPNPFKGNTIISYNLPDQGLSNAQIMVYDATGKRLRMFNLSGQGRGTININAGMLPAGAYQYSLFVNGKLIDTKKMILAK